MGDIKSTVTVYPGFLAAWTIEPDAPAAVEPKRPERPPGSVITNDPLASTKPLVDPNVLNAIIVSGVKVTAQNVVATGVTPTGQLVWLEAGNTYSGLQHILKEHGTQLANMGVSEEEIPKVLMDAITQGKIIDYQGQGTGRPIFQITIGGQAYGIAITIGSNGYIVGVNPRGRVR